jgi:predicted metalloprotease with PDZ domain
VISEATFIDAIEKKLALLSRYDQHVSLVESGLGCYGIHKDNWENAYVRGMLVATILDMHLLELSDGTMNLRDLLNKLSQEFGPTRPFSDERFFDQLAERSYPAIKDFFADYVSGTKPLPIKEYLQKAGYEYLSEYHTGEFIAFVGEWINRIDGPPWVVKDADISEPVNAELCIRNGDTVLKLLYRGREVIPGEGRLSGARNVMRPGEPFSLIVEREGKEVRLTANAGREEIIGRHVITTLTRLSREQEAFRKSWLMGHNASEKPPH